MELRASGKKSQSLSPILPNRSVEIAYREKLIDAIQLMARSYRYWLSSRYRNALEANVDAGYVPDLAQDAKPKWTSKRLFKELDILQKRWDSYFTDLAKRLATGAIDDFYKSNKTAWTAKLKGVGFDIPMQLTAPQELIIDAATRQNVALIKSISQEFHKSIEGVVTRGFVAGRDLNTIATELVKHEDVGVKRAAFIARDQANKLSAQMNSARQNELGLKWAAWKHSSAGKEPRPDHVKASRENWVYDTQVGIDFGDGFGSVLPGTAINCRCGCRTLIPALGRNVANSRTFDPTKLVPVPGFPGAFKVSG